MSMKVELLRKYIREIIKQELKLQEASATGNIDGGEGPPKTPYAFQSKRKKDKEKEDKIAKQSGYSLAETINEITLGQLLAKQGKKIKMVKKPGGGFKMTFVPIAEPEEPKPENESINEGKINEIDYGNVFADMGDKLSDFKMKVVKPGMRIYNKGKANSYMKDLYKSLEKCVDLCDMMNLMANESINEGPAELKKVETIMLTLMKLGRKITDRKQAEKLGAALSNISFLRDMMKNESINEGKYHEYRNDDTLSPKQKIGYSMREVRDKLNELDKLVKMNVRLKNEVGVNSTDYWKNTHNAMKKISERLVKLANKVGQLY